LSGVLTENLCQECLVLSFVRSELKEPAAGKRWEARFDKGFIIKSPKGLCIEGVL